MISLTLAFLVAHFTRLEEDQRFSYPRRMSRSREGEAWCYVLSQSRRSGGHENRLYVWSRRSPVFGHVTMLPVQYRHRVRRRREYILVYFVL